MGGGGDGGSCGGGRGSDSSGSHGGGGGGGGLNQAHAASYGKCLARRTGSCEALRQDQAIVARCFISFIWTSHLGTSSEQLLSGFSDSFSCLPTLVFGCRRRTAQKPIYENRAPDSQILVSGQDSGSRNQYMRIGCLIIVYLFLGAPFYLLSTSLWEKLSEAVLEFF